MSAKHPYKRKTFAQRTKKFQKKELFYLKKSIQNENGVYETNFKGSLGAYIQVTTIIKGSPVVVYIRTLKENTKWSIEESVSKAISKDFGEWNGMNGNIPRMIKVGKMAIPYGGKKILSEAFTMNPAFREARSEYAKALGYESYEALSASLVRQALEKGADFIVTESCKKESFRYEEFVVILNIAKVDEEVVLAVIKDIEKGIKFEDLAQSRRLGDILKEEDFDMNKRNRRIEIYDFLEDFS